MSSPLQELSSLNVKRVDSWKLNEDATKLNIDTESPTKMAHPSMVSPSQVAGFKRKMPSDEVKTIDAQVPRV